jgi:tRNA A-37 threonylcarbamoyl transferase component Bud32
MHYCLDSKGFIIQFKTKENTHSKGIMDIKNWRVLKAKFKDNNGEYIYGLNLMGRKDNQDFYSYQEKDIEEWYDHLIPFCVLLDLNNKYERMNKIGKGNFATVYKYKRKSDGKLFAVKSLEKKKIMESTRRRDSNPLLSEIEIMRAWDHPQVIKLYEVYEAEKHVHLVMEVLEGGELFNRIRNKGTYTEADAIKVMRNVLSALWYLHKKGIVHRDLKPENLILAGNEDDYDVKIADFGLATFVKPGNKLTLPWGSPGYVAFELLQDPSPGYDTKADIFSVGVILYILLTGRPAFQGADCKQILAKNKQGDPPYPKRFWSKISEHGEELVKLMLEKDQDKRVSAEQALLHPWFNENVEDHDLGEAIEGFKEIQENEEQVEKTKADASNQLLTTTPVMAGRHLKDTWESPWNPSGMTPKMDPTTPLLKHGFEMQPRKKVDIPGVGMIGGGQTKQADDSPARKQDDKKATELDTLKKFDMIQAKRNQKAKPQGTMNFGQKLGNQVKKNSEKNNEEIKIDPITKQEIPPSNFLSEEDSNSKANENILDKIMNFEKEKKDDSLRKEAIDKTPETKPYHSNNKLIVSDADVNIKEDDLRECPNGPEEAWLRNARYKSFKPGVPDDNRVIPVTPGDVQIRMSDKNRPLRKVKNTLLKAI